MSIPKRERLPEERGGAIHKFRVDQQEGYIITGTYPDGRLGEVFVKIQGVGTTIRGLMDTIAVLTSLLLQYGVPLEVLVEKFQRTKFEPAGMTDNPKIKFADSLVDYLFRYLRYKFLTIEVEDEDSTTGEPAGPGDPPVPAL